METYLTLIVWAIIFTIVYPFVYLKMRKILIDQKEIYYITEIMKTIFGLFLLITQILIFLAIFKII